jgi:predicted ester cyclase
MLSAMRTLFFARAAAFALLACNHSAGSSTMTATTDTNKTTVRRLFEDGFNRERLDVIDEVVAADYVDATNARGPDAFKQVITRLRSAFPDIHYTLDDVLGDGDGVAVRWHWTGTHRGPFRGIAPTQHAVTNNGAAIFRVHDGKIVAASLETDRLGFLQAIGVVAPNEALFPPPSK